ncbi:hypothetical protein RFI_07222, partial [Reticulomyxa filosa]
MSSITTSASVSVISVNNNMANSTLTRPQSLGEPAGTPTSQSFASFHHGTNNAHTASSNALPQILEYQAKTFSAENQRLGMITSNEMESSEKASITQSKNEASAILPTNNKNDNGMTVNNLSQTPMPTVTTATATVITTSTNTSTSAVPVMSSNNNTNTNVEPNSSKSKGKSKNKKKHERTHPNQMLDQKNKSHRTQKQVNGGTGLVSGNTPKAVVDSMFFNRGKGIVNSKKNSNLKRLSTTTLFSNASNTSPVVSTTNLISDVQVSAVSYLSLCLYFFFFWNEQCHICNAPLFKKSTSPRATEEPAAESDETTSLVTREHAFPPMQKFASQKVLRSSTPMQRATTITQGTSTKGGHHTSKQQRKEMAADVSRITTSNKSASHSNNKKTKSKANTTTTTATTTITATATATTMMTTTNAAAVTTTTIATPTTTATATAIATTTTTATAMATTISPAETGNAMNIDRKVTSETEKEKEKMTQRLNKEGANESA